MKKSFAVVFLIIVFALTLGAPIKAQNGHKIFNNANYRMAIVKVKVNGRNPEGRTKSEVEGSGFIIHSKDNMTLIVTAKHLLGSGNENQELNKDWLVANGRLDRTIRVESLNRRGQLQLMHGNASVYPVGVPEGVDIAVLSVMVDDFPHLDIFENTLIYDRPYDVILMGFRAGEVSLSSPYQSGMGSAHVSGEFVLNTTSRPGESGGPWIDIRTGRVLAVASGQRGSQTQNVAAQVTLILNSLRGFIGINRPETQQRAAERAKQEFDLVQFLYDLHKLDELRCSKIREIVSHLDAFKGNPRLMPPEARYSVGGMNNPTIGDLVVDRIRRIKQGKRECF